MDFPTNGHKSYMKHIILLSASFFGVFFAFNTSQVSWMD